MSPEGAAPAAPPLPPGLRPAAGPPVAAVRPTRMEHHGVVRVDDYHWLNRRDDPEVVAYLEAENRWTERASTAFSDLEETIFREIRGRMVEEDQSVPWFLRGYWYYTRFETGAEYPIHARRRGSMEAPEELLLDVNDRARGHSFYQVGGVDVSGSGRYLAFAADTVGRRIHDIHILDLQTGREVSTVAGTTANLAWADDDRTLFYTRADPVTLRGHQVFRHVLDGSGAAPAAGPGAAPAVEQGATPRVGLDERVFEETDETFSVEVSRTKSWRFILVGSHQTRSSEYHFVDARTPEAAPRVLFPRRPEHLYHPDHSGDHFYIRTDDLGGNFRLVRVPVADPTGAPPEEVSPHRPEIFLADFEIFRDHLVLAERREGLMNLRVRRWDGSGEHTLAFGEPAYRAALGTNPEFDTPSLRYLYSSLTTPNSVFEHHMETREATLLKRDRVLGDFSPDEYVSRRLHATAADGRAIPISVVHRRDRSGDGPGPLLLYGYGAYGSSADAAFSAARLSLLDRGFAFAIAHVRGGQELGRAWYEEGRMLRKQNSFSDFIQAAERLVEEGLATPHRMYALGGSAGGLLVGAVINQRPDLFRGVVAAVPFVDVVTTMLDDSIPLTTGEYDEWGNPSDPVFFRAMLAYSPYDNVEAKAYPHLLVTAGLHDSQVQYWEPAKWVAKLRALKTDENLLLLRTQMEAGHGGVSGRFRSIRETAFQFAFLAHLAGDNE